MHNASTGVYILKNLENMVYKDLGEKYDFYQNIYLFFLRKLFIFPN